MLAAGAGSRMGHRPKCLLQLDGLSLLERQLQALSLAGVFPIQVVLGHHAERILQDGAVARWAAQPVLNPQPDDGHVSSLRIGLRALPPDLDAVVVALADQPLIFCAAPGWNAAAATDPARLARQPSGVFWRGDGANPGGRRAHGRTPMDASPPRSRVPLGNTP